MKKRHQTKFRPPDIQDQRGDKLLISIDKTRLTSRIKSVDAQSMHQIDEGLRLILTL